MSRGGHRRKNVPPEVARTIHDGLVEKKLGVGKPAGGATWRLRVADTDVAYWESRGTLYGALSPSRSPIVSEAWRLIASQTAPPYVPPSRPCLVGLDESGTTEPVGPPFMVAAIVPEGLAPQVWDVVELADTKGKRHPLLYWSALLEELAPLRAEGLDFVVPEVSMGRCKRRDPKPLLDAVYKEILNHVFAERVPADSRVVIDNYGIGPPLCDLLMTLHEAGAEVVPSPASGCPRDEGTQADDRYVEVRAASVMARYRRELFLERVPPDVPMGTMNAEFKSWLQARVAAGIPTAPFLKGWATESL